MKNFLLKIALVAALCVVPTAQAHDGHNYVILELLRVAPPGCTPTEKKMMDQFTPEERACWWLDFQVQHDPAGVRNSPPERIPAMPFAPIRAFELCFTDILNYRVIRAGGEC